MLTQILSLAKSKITNAADSKQLQQIKVEFLGKQGILTQEMKKLASLNEQTRKIFGKEINIIKQQIEELIASNSSIMEEKELNERFIKEKLDLTLPPRPLGMGGIHPITQCAEELIQVFASFGFTVKEGPNIEDDYHNFTALNMGENHPARQMHDTFYIAQGQKLLRTHTSTVQIRSMQAASPPYRLISFGRVYRADWDQTHTPMFHQIEGLVVDKQANFGHLKSLLMQAIKTFFEQSICEIRFRPSFFPFTEPSAEVDIKLHDQAKWLEVLGCGMVHPAVLKNVKLDPEKFQGFAFGLGVERFAMLKYGIKDLRQFFEGDMRWLQHYSFLPLDIPTLAGGLTR